MHKCRIIIFIIVVHVNVITDIEQTRVLLLQLSDGIV